MRDNAPVYYDEQWDVWALTRYADVRAAERDARTFSNAQGIRPHTWPLPMMISMDDPAHLKRCKLVNKGFTARRVRDHEADIHRITQFMIDRVCERGGVRFRVGHRGTVAARPCRRDARVPERELRRPVAVVRRHDPRHHCNRHGGVAARPRRGTGVRRVPVAHRARTSRPPHRRSHLISALVHVEVDGERLDDESLMEEGRLLLISGDETTRHVITGGMHALMGHPEQRHRLGPTSRQRSTPRSRRSCGGSRRSRT